MMPGLSPEVRGKARGAFYRSANEFKRVGELPVRGRKAEVVVYRVAGPHNAEERPGA